jgi:hypothetical protein
MPVTPVNRVVNMKRIIEKNGRPRRRTGTRGHRPPKKNIRISKAVKILIPPFYHVFQKRAVFSRIKRAIQCKFQQRNKVRSVFEPRLPDGISNQKNPNLGKFWRALNW